MASSLPSFRNAHLWKHENGTYYVVWREDSGPRRSSLRTRRYAEAQRKLAGIVARVGEAGEVTGHGDGECEIPGSSCTRDKVDCSWTYQLNITISQDPNKTQVDYLKHRGGTMTVGSKTGIVHNRPATRPCEGFVDMKVKGYDSMDNLLFVIDLEDLVCGNCDEDG